MDLPLIINVAISAQCAKTGLQHRFGGLAPVASNLDGFGVEATEALQDTDQ